MASPFALPAWTFSYDRLCRVFSAYGAPDEILKDEFLLTPLMKNADARTVEKDLKKKSPVSIPNVWHLLQILATSVQYRMDSYAKGKLAQIVFLLLKISLDVRVRKLPGKSKWSSRNVTKEWLKAKKTGNMRQKTWPHG